jgi:hypothetical protein
MAYFFPDILSQVVTLAQAMEDRQGDPHPRPRRSTIGGITVKVVA